jgi:hypothetical protein
MTQPDGVDRDVDDRACHRRGVAVTRLHFRHAGQILGDPAALGVFGSAAQPCIAGRRGVKRLQVGM